MLKCQGCSPGAAEGGWLVSMWTCLTEEPQQITDKPWIVLPADLRQVLASRQPQPGSKVLEVDGNKMRQHHHPDLHVSLKMRSTVCWHWSMLHCAENLQQCTNFIPKREPPSMAVAQSPGSTWLTCQIRKT